MKHRYLWAAISAMLLAAAFTYTLMDAFVLKKPLEGLNITAPPRSTVPAVRTPSAIPTATPSAIATATPVPTPTWQSSYAAPDTDEPVGEYDDGQIYVSITKAYAYDSTFYAAHVMVKDVSYLKSAFAGGEYGRNYTEHASDIAEDNQAIFAVNGDYYGFRDEGLVLRNGTLYRDITSTKALVIMDDGTMRIVSKKTHNAVELINEGAWQGLEFGPSLVEDGAATGDRNFVSRGHNPRCAVGQIGPLDYLFIVVEGRSDDSTGVTCDELAQLFLDRGCEVAYNLDGGGSATMWFQGEVINDPTYKSERRISDILFVGYDAEVEP